MIDLQIRIIKSTFLGDRFSLVRVDDKKIEAAGFETRDEAITWARAEGYDVIENWD
jgi:hypothetical protein